MLCLLGAVSLRLGEPDHRGCLQIDAMEVGESGLREAERLVETIQNDGQD